MFSLKKIMLNLYINPKNILLGKLFTLNEIYQIYLGIDNPSLH